MDTEKIIEKLIIDFKRGMKFTVLSFLRAHGSTELRSFVSKLKKRGMDIISQRVPDKNYNEYYLNQEPTRFSNL